MVKAEWCRRYAQINAVGLRKILKKHDKLCKNKLGNTYMQVCTCCHAQAVCRSESLLLTVMSPFAPSDTSAGL